MINENEELNKLSIYINKRCVRCDRKYPEVVLNIEGYIHHNGKIICLDTKQCNRAVKKIKRS